MAAGWLAVMYLLCLHLHMLYMHITDVACKTARRVMHAYTKIASSLSAVALSDKLRQCGASFALLHSQACYACVYGDCQQSECCGPV